MGAWKTASGSLRIQIISADPAAMLTQANEWGIPLFDVVYVDPLTVQVSLYRKNYHAFKNLLERRGESLEIKSQTGFFRIAGSLRKRPILAFTITLLLILSLYLPSRIYFIKIEGNESIPTHLILDAAESCGISFGASRKDVRSEKVKNALLAAIPDLQWAGVNTSGCVATISVREKNISEEESQTPSGVSSIVAARDGIITDCTVLRGNALCQIGQAVKEGQVLVSGYTDYGITIKATGAQAEIYAETLRALDVITPASAQHRGEITGQETRYSLLLGKNLIKLYKNSGISDTTCVKMYSIDYLTLPGGFQLPLAMVKETLTCYDTKVETIASADLFSWMQPTAERYLQSQMVAGQILSADATLQLDDGVCSLTGQYACHEMIGQVRNEEIIQGDTENN